jgi:transcriptional regulator with XRE-family HTH domain
LNPRARAAPERSALGDFLRARRDRLTPAKAGIGPVSGTSPRPLRREELAVLAGVSADYLRRVEQGRQPNVSEQVLDALARALRLDEVERAHLRRLASPQRPHLAAGADWNVIRSPRCLQMGV